MNEMMNHIEEMKGLIKDEEWHNIPIPVRVACEGIMAYQEKMTSSILFNAEQAHKKVVRLQDQARSEEHKNKTRFEQMDHKYENAVKKLSDRVNNHKAEAKNNLSLVQEQIIKLSD